LRAAAGTLPAREMRGVKPVAEVLSGVPVRQLRRDGANIGRGYNRADAAARAGR
ncbi:hypothetical protein IMZ11_41105, partial [Microtetraspora sp. AC03309]|nr:hypothetical protein [Microtetraspora sp. AC03309]